MLIKLLLKLIKALNSNASPKQLAHGFALGAILGLTPALSLHNILILLIIYILHVNIPIAIVSALLYKIIAILLSGYAHKLGLFILVAEPLQSLWTTMYNLPIVPWSRFYNTVVMGSFVISLILYVPNLFIGKYFVIGYRKYVLTFIEKSKLAKVLKSSKLYKLYNKYQSVKSEL
jgi:uncharacterized protein (TIGR03546 family)